MKLFTTNRQIDACLMLWPFFLLVTGAGSVASAQEDPASSGQYTKLYKDSGAKIDILLSQLRPTEGAAKVNSLVDEIEASRKEQALGLEQIGKAVAHIRQVTQRTAANAGESASASEKLNAQSHALMAVVDQLEPLAGQ